MKTKIKHLDRKIFLIVTTVPILFLYTYFYIAPSVRGLYMSLFSWRGLSMTSMQFVGIKNFIRLFKDAIFYKALVNNLYLFIVSSVFIFALSFFFAVILSGDTLKEKNMYRTIFFFPVAVPMVVVGIIAISVYQHVGILNTLLDAIGLGNLRQMWFGQSNLVKPSLSSFLVWKFLGFYMILNLAAIQNIPNDLYEAAHIDGANKLQQTFWITFPLTWEVIRIQFVFFIVSSFTSIFELVYSTTSGGPDRASEVLVTYMYEQGFTNYQFGYSAALGVVILLITTSLALFLLRISRREVFEM